MTSGMKIFAWSEDFSSCTIYVQSKMTKQPHWDLHISSEIPRFCIKLDVRRSTNVYAIWKSYQYFTLLVNDIIHITCVCFMKKKSDMLSAFREFFILLERYYNIWVCILHTDFGKFNSNVAAKYFSCIGIIWEPSTPNAQQQIGVIKQYIRIVVEGTQV